MVHTATAGPTSLDRLACIRSPFRLRRSQLRVRDRSRSELFLEHVESSRQRQSDKRRLVPLDRITPGGCLQQGNERGGTSIRVMGTLTAFSARSPIPSSYVWPAGTRAVRSTPVRCRLGTIRLSRLKVADHRHRRQVPPRAATSNALGVQPCHDLAEAEPASP